ncbi:MAG: metal-dependent hydrolase [Candidatus Latescibacterota bacterium]|nr:metal-dependent hydrolase [Candidatus Latescibacterota bacterium]
MTAWTARAYGVYSTLSALVTYPRILPIDTVTQLTLGAAVGEAVLGRRAGRRAALWGAVAGMTPDLDVLFGVFTSETTQLGIHRGLSHSFLFATLGCLAGGRLTSYIHAALDIGWRDWSKLWFWGLLTHSLLDAFTLYGTQLFNPFSDYPVALSTIFIIDPLYTLPLLILLLMALGHPPGARARRRLNAAGLIISSSYLLLTGANALHVRAQFTEGLAQNNIAHQRLFATPTPLNNILWMGIAESEDALYVGLYSLFDAESPTHFRRIEKNAALINPYKTHRPLRRLNWFSRGYYRATVENDEIFYHDLRFGRSDLWLDAEGDYIFSFRLLRDPDNPNQMIDLAQQTPAFALSGELLSRFWRRIKGDSTVVQYGP